MAGQKKAMFAPEQKRALLIGFGLILAASAILLLIWLGMFLPGFAGEVFRKLAGMMWTPIIIDCSLFLLGIILVLSLNWFIRSRQGDEYVYLEQVNDPPEGLPDRAHSAIFREAPESQGIQPGLAAIEGALELNDLSEATTLLFELPSDQLEHPGVLALRITLSRRKGHNAKANELLELLRVKSPRHPLCEEQTPLDPPPGG